MLLFGRPQVSLLDFHFVFVVQQFYRLVILDIMNDYVMLKGQEFKHFVANKTFYVCLGLYSGCCRLLYLDVTITQHKCKEILNENDK